MLALKMIYRYISLLTVQKLFSQEQSGFLFVFCC